MLGSTCSRLDDLRPPRLLIAQTMVRVAKRLPHRWILAEDAAIDLAGIRDRVEAEDEGDDAHAHFYPKVLGGAWTAAHAGVVYDRIACMARAHTIDFRRVFTCLRCSRLVLLLMAASTIATCW